jgi:hypothetical protein
LVEPIGGRPADALLALATPLIALLTTGLAFYLNFRKDRREIEGLKLQKKEMELKEIQAQGTIERINLEPGDKLPCGRIIKILIRETDKVGVYIHLSHTKEAP